MTSSLRDAIRRIWRRYNARSRFAPGLKKEQEGFELRRAVWAGFVKSRFWRLKARFDANSFARFVILASSLLLLGIVSLGKGFPGRTEYVFFATISTLSFWYVVRQNAALLRAIWSNDWGKLVYGLLASVTLTVSKVFADQQIRLLVRSDPSLFPSAQQTITVYNIIIFTLVETGSLIWIVVFYRFLKAVILTYSEYLIETLDIFRIREMLGLSRQARPLNAMSGDFADVMAYFWAALFLLLTVSFLGSGSSGIIGGKVFNPTEELFLWSSFIPNQSSASGQSICTNLGLNIWISPVGTKDVMPTTMLSARPLTTAPDGLGRTYEYRVASCTNPANPGVAATVTPDRASH